MGINRSYPLKVATGGWHPPPQQTANAHPAGLLTSPQADKYKANHGVSSLLTVRILSKSSLFFILFFAQNGLKTVFRSNIFFYFPHLLCSRGGGSKIGKISTLLFFETSPYTFTAIYCKSVVTYKQRHFFK